nr:hypothetical protein [Tanacetum cinerariifolium]
IDVNALTINNVAKKFHFQEPEFALREFGVQSLILTKSQGPSKVLWIRGSHNLRDSNLQKGSGFSLSDKVMVFLYAKVEENYLVMTLTNADARDRHK